MQQHLRKAKEYIYLYFYIIYRKNDDCSMGNTWNNVFHLRHTL